MDILTDPGKVHVQFGWEGTTPSGIDANAKTYGAFVAHQAQTAKAEYEHFKSKYAAKSCFGQVEIPFQTFQSGFQVTSAPCLGNQTIKKMVL
jgi:hypothetical protein